MPLHLEVRLQGRREPRGQCPPAPLTTGQRCLPGSPEQDGGGRRLHHLRPGARPASLASEEPAPPTLCSGSQWPSRRSPAPSCAASSLSFESGAVLTLAPRVPGFLLEGAPPLLPLADPGSAQDPVPREACPGHWPRGGQGMLWQWRREGTCSSRDRSRAPLPRPPCLPTSERGGCLELWGPV